MVRSRALIWVNQWKKKRSKAMKTGGRRRKGGDSVLVASKIPLELIIEILIRLPGKSLMRFKSVSKLWSCLIFSRYFSNRYQTVPRPPRLYMSLVEHLDCNSMEVCHNPGKSLLLSLASSSNCVKSLDRDLIIPRIGGHNMVVVRGLILYTVCRKACIYNPTTRQSLTLPAVKSNVFAREESKKHVFYFLGHDSVLDQYKVVCNVVVCSEDYDIENVTSEHWVFVVEAGGSWKLNEFDQPNMPTRLGLCIDGVIYYLAFTSMSRDTVFSFDVRSEEFNMIQAPHEVSEFGESLGFIEYCGKPTIFDYTHLVQKGMVDLWVLEDGGKWSKKSLVLQSCQMHLFDNNIDLNVVCTTQKGEVILATVFRSDYILHYNFEKNDLRKVNIIGGIPNQGFSKSYIYFSHMDSETIMHLET